MNERLSAALLAIAAICDLLIRVLSAIDSRRSK